MIYGLLYSGGVDSIVCLKLLREQGITPVLFHYQYKSLKKHYKRIKKTAKLLSPESPLYVWEVPYYQVSCNDFGDLFVHLGDKNYVEPSCCVDKLAIGYFEKDVMDNKYLHKGDNVWTGQAVKYLIKNSKIYLPIQKLTKKQIEKKWKTLPKEVRINTLTSSRGKNGEWIVI